MSRECPDLATEDFLELAIPLPKKSVQHVFDKWCFDQQKKQAFGFLESSEAQMYKREKAIEILDLAFIEEKGEGV